MRFFPLAMAEMKGKGVCIAGVDADTGQWIRPVKARYRCVFPEQAVMFEWNYYHDLSVGGWQPRGSKDDPLEHHTEDRVLSSVRRQVPVSCATEKRDLLDRATNGDFAAHLTAGRRSLFLVRPGGFTYEVDDRSKPRFRFTPPLVDTGSGMTARRLEEQRIAVSRSGIPCTCPRWKAFAQFHWPNAAVSERSLKELDPSSEFYLTVSLSALHDDVYSLIVAGAHVVGKDALWL